MMFNFKLLVPAVLAALKVSALNIALGHLSTPSGTLEVAWDLSQDVCNLPSNPNGALAILPGPNADPCNVPFVIDGVNFEFGGCGDGIFLTRFDVGSVECPSVNQNQACPGGVNFLNQFQCNNA